MACIYCKGPVKPLGTINHGATNHLIETFFFCKKCQTYMHYENEYLIDYEIVNIQTDKGKFIYKVYPCKNIVEVYGYSKDNDQTHIVFILQHIPNWKPSNLAEKIGNLVIFS